jgi:hypothetical protein
MEDELVAIKKIFPEAYIIYNEERDVSRLYIGQTRFCNADIYIVQNEFSGQYFLFIDSFRTISKDFNKILAALQAIKDCEE